MNRLEIFLTASNLLQLEKSENHMHTSASTSFYIPQVVTTPHLYRITIWSYHQTTYQNGNWRKKNGNTVFLLLLELLPLKFIHHQSPRNTLAQDFVSTKAKIHVKKSTFWTLHVDLDIFLPDKNYIILADTMHTFYRKVSNGQKVDGLDLSFKTSKMVTFSEWSPAFSRKFSVAT